MSGTEKFLELCFTPHLLPLYDLRNKTVVVIDIFRASSAICTALAHGIEAIIPVKEIEEAIKYREDGYLVAAERHGQVVEGFSIGNSPFSFMEEAYKGKIIVLTTTNCTTAIHSSREAGNILIGSFLNISALADFLLTDKKDTVLLCAGWKGRFNLEDSIFAGALASRIQPHFRIEDDSVLAAITMYEQTEGNLADYLHRSSHSRRLEHLHIGRDVEFCLQSDKYNVIPHYDGKAIRLLTK